MKEILGIIKVLDVTPEYQVAKAIIQVSSASDLPSGDELIQGVKCAPGSFAQVIQEGILCSKDEDDNWYDKTGNEV